MSIGEFQKVIWDFYRKNKRDFPWRHTRDPWRILVSEVMLQQTQAARVVPFYKKFVKKFPTPRALSRARLKTVMRYWSGLGYNRRALALQRAAEILVREHHGTIPRNVHKLDALPGIGTNTAAAIFAYAWNEPVVFVETNIRTVFLHHFFPHRKKVGDEEILKLVERTLPGCEGKQSPVDEPCGGEPAGFVNDPSEARALDNGEPSRAIRRAGGGYACSDTGALRADNSDTCRHWYSALMDYGTHLKQTLGNPNARSARYTKQTKFTGSVRQMRGEILRRALAGTLRARDFPASLLADLVHEGFLKKRGKNYEL